jgi:DNA-binding MurR/RpiR family transcriptional regulator
VAAADFIRELELRMASTRPSRNDERILAFVREHIDELAFHTSESIAQGAGVSRAAVVRFSLRLGLGGFAQLRERYREHLRSEQPDGAGAPQAAGDTDAGLLARKIGRDIQNLELLAAMLAPDLDRAARIAQRARRLWVIANRETHGLAVYFHRLVHHIRSEVRLVDPAFPDPLRDLDGDDALLACTFRPYARQTIAMVRRAREARASVIVITDGTGHRFLEPDDLVLAVPVQSPTMFLSFVSALSALEALAAAISRIDPDHTYQTREATGRFLEGQELMLEPGPVTGKRRHQR